MFNALLVTELFLSHLKMARLALISKGKRLALIIKGKDDLESLSVFRLLCMLDTKRKFLDFSRQDYT